MLSCKIHTDILMNFFCPMTRIRFSQIVANPLGMLNGDEKSGGKDTCICEILGSQFYNIPGSLEKYYTNGR